MGSSKRLNYNKGDKTMTKGEIANRIDQIEYARDDAKEASYDDYYAACFPLEHAGIESFIDECNRQIKSLEQLLIV